MLVTDPMWGLHKLLTETRSEMAERMNFEDRCLRVKREVEEMHRFFEDWFNGTLPKDDASFARFEGSISDDFVLVEPSGAVVDRATLAERLRAAHGSWPAPVNGEPVVEISDVRSLSHHGDTMLFAYVERQNLEGKVTRRQSTALFRSVLKKPNRLEWLHVHETWLTPPAPQEEDPAPPPPEPRSRFSFFSRSAS